MELKGIISYFLRLNINFIEIKMIKRTLLVGELED